MQRTLVLGCGRMGAQIGVEWALTGAEVTWLARSVERARSAIDRAVALVEATGVADAAQTRALRERAPAIVTSLEAVDGSIDLVIESIVEDLAAKTTLLQAAAAYWPEAILASNTSSLSIGAIGEATGAPERTIGMHYLSPPLLMAPVEVVRGGRTSDAVVQRVTGMLRAAGKTPVVVSRDVPGFVWNRLQFALLREALWLVDNGVASADAIDEVVRSGLARRWRHTGPLESAALGGVGTFAAIAANLFPELSDATDAGDLASRLPADPAYLEAARQRRDQALGAELRAERALDVDATSSGG